MSTPITIAGTTLLLCVHTNRKEHLRIAPMTILSMSNNALNIYTKTRIMNKNVEDFGGIDPRAETLNNCMQDIYIYIYTHTHQS